MNDAVFANTFSDNGADGEEQIKSSTNSCGIYNENGNSDDVIIRTPKCISLIKKDIHDEQGSMKDDFLEESTLLDAGIHNSNPEGEKNLEAFTQSSYKKGVKNVNVETQISGQEGGQILEVEPPSFYQEGQNLEADSSRSCRRQKLENKTPIDAASGDSSEEDICIYAESFRCSNWVRVDQKDELENKMEALATLESSRSFSSVPGRLTDGAGAVYTDGELSSSLTADDVFLEPLSQPGLYARKPNQQSDSITLTDTKFEHSYMSRRKCLIQRADSQQEYHRLSSRMYDQNRQVVIERIPGCEDLGLHLLDSFPAYITSVVPGSAAEKAGITDGQILVSINNHTVLTTNHADIVKLIHSSKGNITLGVASSNFQPVRDLKAAIMSGHMLKLDKSRLKIWKKRYFILRQDNSLYYYRNAQETDPLGAFPLGGYTVSRHSETSKEFCFKAEKFGGRTYYFCVDSQEQMTAWVAALSEASIRSKKRKESFLSVSSHNIGLPALHILHPECAGFLSKLSLSRYVWRHRYCILKDACVYYYQDKSSSRALGVIHFHGYTVHTDNYQRRKYSFSLQPPEQKMRVFAFCADNETDKTRWVELLIHSIQRWVGADKEIGSV